MNCPHLLESLTTNYNRKKTVLLLEQEEVMSMEGMEVEICNSGIYGVSYEVEKTDREISQQSLSR